jgi:hypothetical protein
MKEMQKKRRSPGFQNHDQTPKKKTKEKRYIHAAEKRLPNRSFQVTGLGTACAAIPKR